MSGRCCSSCLHILYVWVRTRDIEISWFHIAGQKNTLALGDRTGWFWDPPQTWQWSPCVCVGVHICVCVRVGSHRSCWQDAGWCCALCSPCSTRTLVLASGRGMGGTSFILSVDACYGGDIEESDPPCILLNWRRISSQGNRSLKLRWEVWLLLKGL